MSVRPDAGAAVGLGPWLLSGARRIGADLRRHRYLRPLVLLVGAIWVLALVRLFVHHVPVLPLLVNWSASLPYKVAIADYRSATLQRGDLVVYAFAGPAADTAYPGLRGQALFKRVAGVAGDTVTVQGRDVFVNGVFVGRAKTHSFDRRPLEAIAPTVIPAGQLYVQGSGVDSFDSRYALSGLVRAGDVKVRVIPVF